jgi:phosphoribosylaminoimidazole-succinocarboxamide synthase
MPDDFVNQVSERYIELYEKITGDKFVRADVSDVLSRVQHNITNFLNKL